MKDPEVERAIGSAGRAFEVAQDLGVMGTLQEPAPLRLAVLARPERLVGVGPGLRVRSGLRRDLGHKDLLDYAKDRGAPHGFDVLTPPRFPRGSQR